MLLHRLLNGSRILLSPAHASNTPVVESVWFGSRSSHDSLFIATGEALTILLACVICSKFLLGFFLQNSDPVCSNFPELFILALKLPEIFILPSLGV